MLVDMSGVASAVVAGVFSVMSVAVPMMINKLMKDKQAAAVLSNAVVNSLGAIQQAAVSGKRPPIIYGVPPHLATGVAYVRDHAGAEADRFHQTPEMLADKIDAKIGLYNLKITPTEIATPPVAAVGDFPLQPRFWPDINPTRSGTSSV